MGVVIRYALIGFIIYLVIKAIRRRILTASSNSGPYRTNDQSGSENFKSKSPFEILELPKSASKEQIKRAYRQKLAEYHPDKVSHLGDEIQKVAQKKTQEISWAYDQIK